MGRLDSVVVSITAALLVLFAASSSEAQQQEKASSQWAPSATFMLGEFNTDTLGSLVESTLDLRSDIRGRSWDIGVTRGRPGHSYFRISYAEMRIRDGSWTDDGSTLSVTSAVKVRGVKFERMWRLGPSRWKVAPTLELHGGAGKISGTVTQTDHYEDFVQLGPGQYGFVERVGQPVLSSARELLGLEWLPIGGLSIGAAADLGDRLTVAVRAYGMEFPGTYAGGVQLTYWPRRSK